MSALDGRANVVVGLKGLLMTRRRAKDTHCEADPAKDHEFLRATKDSSIRRVAGLHRAPLYERVGRRFARRSGLSAIIDIEMNLHVKLCAGWGLSPSDLEQVPPAVEMLAYTRYVLDAGMRGDLLALKVALAPCVIGYAEIATRLASRPDAFAATNSYRVWIAEYAGVPYQEVAAKARAHLEHLADLYATPAREAELIAIFKEATRLEADFWEMGWRMHQRVV